MSEELGEEELAPPAEWIRYGNAVSAAMSEVMAEVAGDVRPVVIETAEYWLAIGLIVGIRHEESGRRLLRVIEGDEQEASELAADAAVFISEALE